MKWLIISLILFFINTFPVFAARSLIISDDKASLQNDDVLTITASPSGFTNNELIYIKGAFYKDGQNTNNYFGFTQNADNWIKNSQTMTDQLQVTMGQWDGTLHVKSDFGDTGFTGNDDYKFKVGFYYSTASNNWSAVQWSDNVLTVNLHQPDPTATPTAGPTNTPTPTLTPTSGPTAIPTPTIMTLPTSVPEEGDIIPTIGTQEYVNAQDNGQGQLLNLGDSPPPTSPSPMVLGESTSKPNSVLPLLIIGVGIIGLIVSLILLFLHARKTTSSEGPLL